MRETSDRPAHERGHSVPTRPEGLAGDDPGDQRTTADASDPSWSIAIGIAAVERDTGIPKETLRVWERRYGFPRPGRDQFGERTYPSDQVERLRVIRRLLANGYRPGRVVRMSLAQLQALNAESAASEPRSSESPAVASIIEQLLLDVAADRTARVRDELSLAAARLGLGRFLIDLFVPLHRRVLMEHAAGRLMPHQERLFVQVSTHLLHVASATIPVSHNGPVVLLATLPGESADLPLLVHRCLVSLERARGLMLGARVPVAEIGDAAIANSADIVLLHFGSTVNPAAMLEGARTLRARLPSHVEIWAAGRAHALQRRPAVENVVVLDGYRDVLRQCEAWRAARREQQLEEGGGRSAHRSASTGPLSEQQDAASHHATAAHSTASHSAATPRTAMPHSQGSGPAPSSRSMPAAQPDIDLEDDPIPYSSIMRP